MARPVWTPPNRTISLIPRTNGRLDSRYPDGGSAAYPSGFYDSHYPLELVSPRAAGTAPSLDAGTPNIQSGHRIFRAYPGVEYSIRAVVFGGAYPYTFSLSNAPSGMTIDTQSGVITWLDPQANAEPTITVTDMQGTQVSSSWSIVVGTAGFKFVDAVNGNDSDAGTLAAPWQTLLKVYNDGGNDIVYLRAGNYGLAGIPVVNSGGAWQRVEFSAGTRPVQWLGFPGERPVIDNGYESGVDSGSHIRITGNATYPVYLQNITAGNARNMIWQLGGGHYTIMRDLHLRDIWDGTDGDNPAGIMLLSSYGNERYYPAFQELTSSNLVRAGLCKWNSTRKMVVEDVVGEDATDGPDIKANIIRYDIRRTILKNFQGTSGTQAIFGNMNAGGITPLTQGEIRFCLVLSDDAYSGAALELNQDSQAGETFVYRCTFVGRVRLRNVDSSDGPFRLYANVFVTSDGGDGIWRDSVTDNTRIVLADNLVGTRASGIVDANGLLTGANRTNYLNQRGHEIEGVFS